MEANEPTAGRHRHLDATAGREVVFCHQCQNQWYRDELGLVCPRCDSEFTETVSADNDPRPAPAQRPSNEDLRALHSHNPWAGEQSDPEEEDIDQYAMHPPGGNPYDHDHMRGYPGSGDPSRQPGIPDVMSDFQRMVSSMMGPGLQQGPAGRSGPESLFGGYPPNHEHGGWPRPSSNFQSSTFGSGNVRGARFTWTMGGSTSPRDPHGPQQGPPVEDITRLDSASSLPRPPTLPPPARQTVDAYVLSGSADEIDSLLSSLFGAMGPNGHQVHVVQDEDMPPALPAGLANFFAALGNPANAVSGDAVYTQEALDRIISGFMDQHPTSNAPGPASASAIAALPKKAVDEKMLGTEGKAECSVCMDDVALGDEVVALPCSHWFHEACASAWLSEHNTCPICRTGIGGEDPAPSAHRPSRRRSVNDQAQQPRPSGINLQRRRSSFVQATRNITPREQERLARIRNAGAASGDWASNSSAPEVEERPRRRYHVVGDGNLARREPPPMPGAFQPDLRTNASPPGYQSPSRRSSSSTGSSGQNGAFSWLRRLGGGNGGGGSGSGR